MYVPSPLQILQPPGYIVILHERMSWRTIPLDGRAHLPDHLRLWQGDSIGRWEGDTLVVETTNFTDKTQFRGSGENLKVTERFTRLDDGNLLYRFTVEDPTTWDRAWTGEYTWNTSTEPIYEYACHEANYALSGVLKGARLLESEAAKRP